MTLPFALIIEDDSYQADIFEIALQSAEFDTEIIQDGQLALNRLVKIIPDLIVLDLHLPTVSGQSILEHIRTDERLREIKVILATADYATADLLESQSDLVLLKPISVPQLSELAKRLRPPDLMME